MSTIFVNQSKLRLQLTTGVDITDATSLLIKYKKPDGTAGSWTATSSDDDTGVIYYDFTDGELSASGVWTFWAYITFSDGRVAPGEKLTIRVKTEGT